MNEGARIESSLDPADLQGFRHQAHRMLDDMIDYVATIRTRPVWQPLDASLREDFRRPSPRHPTPLADVYRDFASTILPYTVGNVHPGFMGWVHGGGTLEGMLAEMLAGALNANCGGRDHAPIELERQLTAWVCEWLGFPQTATGLFVTGTSMANFVALLVARHRALGANVRGAGVGAEGARLTAYASSAAHGCVPRAFEYAGLGRDALRAVAVDRDHRMDIDRLRDAITADRKAGRRPFLIVGTAGSVNTGAFDDLSAVAALAAEEGLWFHVDGAYGAFGVLCDEIAPRLAGIEQADSVALDFHKWGQVPYDAGFILIRDGALHRAAFATEAEYLTRATRGLAAGEHWPNDYGPDLSRGFRALKAWFTLRVHGTERLGAMIGHTCRVARHLAARIASEPELELLAPPSLNIVCFRYRHDDPDAHNARIVADLQLSGIAAPSTTRIDGRLAIRAAIFNHRTEFQDVERLVDAVLRLGRRA
ncbi:MAG: cytochrome D ubiquinol oxidase subunit I [Proteobacteria bacterium]|nr:cytochrome D ubiquinol oxidase subunit I [Pseudomonadota bacterium]